MSEYQYYEFRAIDEPLTDKQMVSLRALSTRAEITPTSLTNTYQFGSFKGDPKKLMDQYFDAFVYVANWGSRRLMLRIPAGFLDTKAIVPYCDDEVLSMQVRKEHIVLDFRSEDEPEGWTEGEGWMPSLISLRAEMMRGDFRPLYLGWLSSLGFLAMADEDERTEAEEYDQLEPPVPPGLARLSKAQSSLADFLRIDDDLLKAAAAVSAREAPAEPSRDDMARWIKSLRVAEKNDYLFRFLAEEGDIRLRAELTKRFRQALAPKGKRIGQETPRRTVAQLLTARDHHAEKRERKGDRKRGS